MKIEGGQIRGAHFNFFLMKKRPFFSKITPSSVDRLGIVIFLDLACMRLV